jgi:hypothetical protein
MKRVLAVAALVGGFALWAQEFRGTLTGRVMDPQDSVVPSVKVESTEVNTGSKRATVTGGDGLYTLPFLSPGLYRVTVEAPGFKRYVNEGIQVSTNERVGLDIKLEIGQVADSVIITADSPILQTATASTGQVINSRQIDNMPLNGRTPLSLAQLAMGVVPASDPRFTRPFDNAGPAGFSSGGAPSQTNELLFDGAPDNTKDNRVAYNPPVDAVAEVKVESFQADAAYGHTGGGTVNVVMKSGSNSLHGSAYDFNQLSNLAATPFFNNSSGQTKARARYNQWGATVGGPLVIPKLIDGRNRVFFFLAYEGIDNMASKPTFATVPTAAERTGNFSALLNLGSSYQIYDPLTGAAEGARIRRQPFAGNVIPAARFNTIAKNYLERFYPLPNVDGGKDGLNNFYNGRNGELNTFDNELSRFDFNLNDRHKLFWSFRHNVRYGSGASNLGQPISSIPSDGGSIRVNWGSMVDDVYTFTPATILNTRLSWTRYSQYTTNYSPDFDMTTLGFSPALKAASIRQVLPQISLTTFQGAGVSAGGPNPEDTFQIFSTLNKLTGAHNLKIGVDLRQQRNSQINYGSSSGSYTFSTNWTRGPLDNSSAAPLGQDLASFLLGLPTSGAWDVNSARTNQNGYYAFFVQDDYRPARNLTLNLGLRYEFETPTTERYNRTTNGFDFTTPNPISAQVTAAYAKSPIAEIPAGQFKVPGGLLFASPDRATLYSTNKQSFSPRAGFAWTPASLGGKTVFRGGTGIFFFPYGVTGYSQTGFNQRTDLVASNDGFLTPYATLNNPFPQGIQQPAGSSQGLATFLGRNVTFFNPTLAAPYSVRWNFDIQRQLSKDLVLEAAYLGNHSAHLAVDRQINYIPRQYLSPSATRDQAAIDRLTANVANPFANLVPGTTLNGATVARSQLLVPFPQFTVGAFNSTSTGVIQQSTNAGSSYFHQLQVRLEKRFAHGLQFLANYSYSKLMRKTTYLNLSDTFSEKRIAAEDRPQRLVLSSSYELPFGRGRTFGAHMHPVLNQVAGGWTLNGIFVGQSGSPLDWISVNPIYYGGDIQLDSHIVNRSFDTARFNTKSNEQLDTVSQIRTFPTAFSNLRADKALNFDLSATKDFPIFERLRLQFRAEFFNAMNHPEFSSPALAPTSSNFGKITSQANSPRAIQLALRLIW